MENTSIAKLQDEAIQELSNKEVLDALLITTFKGLDEPLMKQAIMDGIIRGFTFKDFRERNVYAIPFRFKKDDQTYGLGYSLVTSIDYARKIGMRSGIVGEDAPVYGEDSPGKFCSVTVRRNVDGVIGTFTAKVYFDEYSTGKNLWTSKPLTMIAKVAEMHALRKACPEELSQQYVEEELEKGAVEPIKALPSDIEPYRAKLLAAKDLAELGTIWSALPADVKTNKDIEILKADLKLKFDPDSK